MEVPHTPHVLPLCHIIPISSVLMITKCRSDYMVIYCIQLHRKVIVHNIIRMLIKYKFEFPMGTVRIDLSSICL